jgi:hypothetical protein
MRKLRPSYVMEVAQTTQLEMDWDLHPSMSEPRVDAFQLGRPKCK